MPITFNGDVTINGRAEFYDNGSLRISSDQADIHIDDLKSYISNNLSHSINLEDYQKAAEIIKGSDDKNKIVEAFKKIINMGRELGKAIWINGLSKIAIEAAKELLK